MASISIKKVSKVYTGGTQALFDCNLEIRDGDFMVLLGPSLCGKSTLVRTIAGLEEVTSGDIEIGDKSVVDLSPRDRDVAMVFASNSLDAQRNVFENMAYGLRLRKAPKEVIDARVNEAAAIFGLTDLLMKKPKQLTPIERQRVLLGRVIVREPKAFLLDEPLGGLDRDLRAQVRMELARLHLRFRQTFVYVTAEKSEAMLLATRIAVLKDGFIQQTDTPQNLYDYPVNLFVADYLGALGFVRGGKLTEEGGKCFAEVGDARIPLSERLAKRIQSGYFGSGKAITVAIRPEDVKITEKSDLRARVTASKNGEATLAIGTLEVTVKGEWEEGREVGIAIDADRILLFDGETDRTILAHDEGYRPAFEKDAEYLPHTPQEMKERIEKSRPKPVKKGQKKPAPTAEE